MNTELRPILPAVSWSNNQCVLLDQARIPKEEVYLSCPNYRSVIHAIQKLQVRGAPAIGVAGAFACVLAFQESIHKDGSEHGTLEAFEEIKNARPTAVNLAWAVERMKQKMEGFSGKKSELSSLLLDEAKQILIEDIQCNQRMAKLGANLLPQGANVLTCCNTGDLATGGIGTAFGILREGFNSKRVSHVYACETRPVLQGLRLTTYELEKNKIPYTAICDNMAASLMKKGKISAVITGADRIASNGDAANKIGTYSLAVLAKHHGVPFYIAAPYSTFDLSLKSGDEIPIEERSADEIVGVLGENLPAYQIPVYNPSFDVTPNALITAIVCDRGVIGPVNKENVIRVIQSSVV